MVQAKVRLHRLRVPLCPPMVLSPPPVALLSTSLYCGFPWSPLVERAVSAVGGFGVCTFSQRWVMAFASLFKGLFCSVC